MNYLFMLLILSSLSSFAGTQGLYGKDDRLATYEVTDKNILKVADSSAALIPLVKLEPYKVKGGYSVKLGGYDFLCSTEKFFDTAFISNCSGTLISPTSILTAGHCVGSTLNPASMDVDYSNWVWVFGYKVDPLQKSIFIADKDVYHIKATSVLGNSGDEDYAIMDLNRPVLDKSPVTFRQSGVLPKADKLYLVGHPTGLPQVVSPNGREIPSLVLPPKEFMVTNLDAFAGNSGSGVFNQRTHELEGILIQGRADYTYNEKKKCNVPAKCLEGGCPKHDGYIYPGEIVYKVSNVKYLETTVHKFHFRSQARNLFKSGQNEFSKRAINWLIEHKELLVDDHGQNLLFSALELGNEEIANFILKDPVILNAARKDEIDFLGKLLRLYGSERLFTALDTLGESLTLEMKNRLLKVSFDLRYPEMMNQFILKGADINTLFELALSENRLDLLNNFATSLRFEEFNIAQMAMKLDHKRISWLLEKGHSRLNLKNKNSEGNTLLHLAIKRLDLELVQLCLKFKIDASLLNANGETAEKMAKRLKFKEAVKLIKKA